MPTCMGAPCKCIKDIFCLPGFLHTIPPSPDTETAATGYCSHQVGGSLPPSPPPIFAVTCCSSTTRNARPSFATCRAHTAAPATALHLSISTWSNSESQEHQIGCWAVVQSTALALPLSQWGGSDMLFTILDFSIHERPFPLPLLLPHPPPSPCLPPSLPPSHLSVVYLLLHRACCQQPIHKHWLRLPVPEVEGQTGQSSKPINRFLLE